MPYKNDSTGLGEVYELARSSGQVTFNTGTTIQSLAIDCRDIASVGFSDFPSNQFLPPSQVWRIGYSFAVWQIDPGLTDARQLYAAVQSIYNWGGGVLSFYTGTPIHIPVEITQVVHGEWRMHSDGARVVFNNTCGANLTVEYSVWAKAS